MVETTTPIHYTARQAPLPEPAAGDYLYGSKTVTGDRHFFERLPDGRLQMPSSLCMRERFTHAVSPSQGVGWCQACVAELRDTLRATVVALGLAGIRTDLPAMARQDVRTPDVDDDAGNHYAWPAEGSAR
jgi:hypothetical protein